MIAGIDAAALGLSFHEAAGVYAWLARTGKTPTAADFGYKAPAPETDFIAAANVLGI